VGISSIMSQKPSVWLLNALAFTFNPSYRGINRDQKLKKELISKVADQMSHSKETCNQLYQRITNKETFLAQEIIEQICSNKYFRKHKSDIIF